jgi:hypothetical protein
LGPIEGAQLNHSTTHAEEEREREREKWVVVRETTTEFIIGSEGSQALPVCPYGKCKLLTGTIEVYYFLFIFLLGLGGLTGCVWRKF